MSLGTPNFQGKKPRNRGKFFFDKNRLHGGTPIFERFACVAEWSPFFSKTSEVSAERNPCSGEISLGFFSLELQPREPGREPDFVLGPKSGSLPGRRGCKPCNRAGLATMENGPSARIRSFEKRLADRGGWREEILHMPEIQASFLCPFSYAPLGRRETHFWRTF